MNQAQDFCLQLAELAGNWRKWPGFAWNRPEIDDPERWAIFTTRTRDSDDIERSNARVISRIMAEFPADALAERHRHWAVG